MALLRRGLCRDAESEVTLGPGEISVHANELEYSGTTSSGGIIRLVTGGYACNVDGSPALLTALHCQQDH